jgi:hypothetical protein
MKHARTLGLLVGAVVSLTAFVGGASAAPVLTSPAGTEYTGAVEITLESGSSTVFKAGLEDSCSGTKVTGKSILNTLTQVIIILTAIQNLGCTQDTTTVKTGELVINDAGEAFTKESRIEIKATSLGITCFYGAETGSVKIGTFTGGTPAKLDVNTTTLQRESGSNAFFCAEKGTWTGNFVVTSPSTLLLT